MHAILLFDAIRHDPWIGYDGEAHVQYIDALAKGRLPGVSDTPEWYSPPLPYLLPAVWRAAGFSLTSAAKVAQLLNVVFSAILVVYLLKICERLRPGALALKLLAAGFLGMLPVYYRTFATVRGEPLLAAAAVVAAHEAIALFVIDEGDGGRSLGRALKLGLALGVVLLGRQWGFFMLPAFGLLAMAAFVRRPGLRVEFVKSAVIASIVIAVVSGWFYAHLAMDFGSVKAFGRGGARSFSLSNQVPRFYLGLGLDKLFTDPVRPSFPNQLLPTFYSDTWGDYWCYFVVYGKDTRTGKYISGFYIDRALYDEGSSQAPGWLETNRETISAYLGRVNLVSLLPTVFLLAGLVPGLLGCWMSLRAGPVDRVALIRAFVFLLVAFTWAGYFWFLVMYPSPEKGRTIKPTYIMQIFPFVSLLAAEVVYRIGERSRMAYRWLVLLLVLCAAHNLPAMITRYL
jgi:hypothetical protein